MVLPGGKNKAMVLEPEMGQKEGEHDAFTPKSILKTKGNTQAKKQVTFVLEQKKYRGTQVATCDLPKNMKYNKGPFCW